jgi:type VI secretion system protein ImpA
MDPALARLLEPISADQPCGPDLGYDPRYDTIETLLKGKPEVDIGSVVKPAEPPDWGQLRSACLEFLQASRHLRPVVVLSCAALKTHGLPGFRDVVQVLRGLIEQRWATVYPLLDPDDNNDPQQRLNIISGLTAARGSYGLGWLQILGHLCTVPLCRPKGAPPITLDLIAASAAPRPAPAEGAPAPTGPDAAEIARAFQSVGVEEISSTRTVVTEIREAIQGIDTFLTNTLGSSGTIAFTEIEGVLNEIDRALAAQLPDGAAGTAGADASGTPTEEGGSSAADAAGAGPITGAIRSRRDVVEMLQKICDYYERHEPGSPMPFMLRRTQKLATMNFVQMMEELNLASIDQLKSVMGSTVEPPPSE